MYYFGLNRQNFKSTKTHSQGALGSGSPLYSAINKPQELPVSTPRRQENPETAERQMASSKSFVLLIAEAIAASVKGVNANRIPVQEPSVLNGDPSNIQIGRRPFMHS